MDWFRWWHDSISDTKFRLIAEECSVEPGKVIAIWIALLECASKDPERGCIASLNIKLTSFVLGFEISVVQKVIACMEQMNLICDEMIVNWDGLSP